ncbi:MAG TPA: MFS transporter [Caulobacteraceae bacterium]|jgi:PPP family 3-phenylpropionic acid transporter|nr:MFS transporter [Caulobacteraceae bacterium]
MLKTRVTDSAVRMALFYAVTFAGTGVSLPFIGRWFSAHGLSGAEIGVVLGAPMLARLVSSPLIAVWADSFRLRRAAVLGLALIVFSAYVAIALTHGFAWWFAFWFVAATALGNIIPLTDVLSLRRARREGFTFAIPRGVGSLAFILGNVITGWLLTRMGVNIVLVWIVAAAAAMAFAAWVVLPPEPVSDDGPVSRAARFQGLGRLVGDAKFMTAICAIGLIQAAHAAYYGFSAILWKAQGLSDATTGLLWGAGVTAEIVFFWFLEPWRRRVGPLNLLLLSGVGSVIRWTAFAFSPPLWLLWPLQLLHALTFTACYIGGLHLVEEIAPKDSLSAAQTLSSALSAGAFIGLATILSGALYDRYGAYAYLAMSAMALAGLLCAVRLGRGWKPAASG